MDIKICDRCGKRINEVSYKLFDYTEKPVKPFSAIMDLCPKCYAKFKDFMEGKENGSCGISEESNENGKGYINSNEKQPSD